MGSGASPNLRTWLESAEIAALKIAIFAYTSIQFLDESFILTNAKGDFSQDHFITNNNL